MKKPSRQIEALIGTLDRFPDEHLSEEIREHMQDAFGQLQEVQLELEEAGW